MYYTKILYYIDEGCLNQFEFNDNQFNNRDSGDIFKSGDKMVCIDEDTHTINHNRHKYGSTPPSRYCVAVSFLKKTKKDKSYVFIKTADGDIVQENIYRKPNVSEMGRFSKYPDTSPLRDYLNSMHELEVLQTVDHDAVGNEIRRKCKGLGPHLHIDDFISAYKGKISACHRGEGSWSGLSTGSYIDVNYNGGRCGFHAYAFDDPSEYRDHPYRKVRPLCGSYMSGMFMLDQREYDFNNFFKDYYDERDPVYVKLDRDRFDYNPHQIPLKLWDPVSDIVRVERISGNDTFISEYGYICSIQFYSLIIAKDYTRWRMRALDKLI